MDSTQILSMLERLDDEIDDLEDALKPVTTSPLVDIVSKLPLLDKAKLYINITYSIESILFSYLRLHGVKAKEHAVFTELIRVKQYFDKLKLAENPVAQQPNLALDKKAAARFITAGLRGNDQYDLAKADHQAKEKAHAHTRFPEDSRKRKQASSERLELDSTKRNKSSEFSDEYSTGESKKERDLKQDDPAISARLEKLGDDITKTERRVQKKARKEAKAARKAAKAAKT